MWGGYSKVRYALIGLSIYAFHYDLSKTLSSRFLLPYYLIAYNDLHNFYMPADEYRKFFRAEYLAARLPLEPFDLNDPFCAKRPLSFITPKDRLNMRKVVDTRSNKFYPETRDENVKILDDYLTLCERNNIRPIMFLVPVTEGYIKHFSKQVREEFLYLVRQACRKHPNAIFLDGWCLQGFTDRDFFESTHLNLQGAAKFSAFLNDFIESL